MEAETLLDAVAPLVAAGEVPGAVVGVLHHDRVSRAAAGMTATSGGIPMAVDTPVRISSNTKPMAAALALSLAQDGALSLADPVERYLPELAGQRVLRHLEGPSSDTVAAERPATIEDLLTMRLGFGSVLEADCPAVGEAARAGLGIGPPDPAVPAGPEEWIARFAELPLLDQPGTVWRYDLAYAVLGVVLARAGEEPLDDLLRSRLLAPLEMPDTSFVAPPGRLPTCYAADEAGLVVFDSAVDSRWAAPPSFPDARNGLVSTAADMLRFAAALLEGGGGVLTSAAVTAMTTDRLTPRQRRGPSAEPFLDGFGWGYGVQVATAQHGPSVRRTRYGWGGGLGTLWYSWPDEGAAAVLLTQVSPPSRQLITAFTDAAEIALDA